VPGSTLHLIRVDDFEKIPGMSAFVIGTLCGPAGSVLEAGFQVILGNLLDIRISRDGVPSEALLIESGKGIGVGYKPRFHRLCHEVAVIFMRVFIAPLLAGS
jgi:hypothetical protein